MYLFLGMLLGSCGSSIQAKSQKENVDNPTNNQTYWDDYDFNNVALIHQPDITEQKFANFCVALSNMSEPERSRQVDTLLTRSLRGSRDMFANFMTLAEKYLYDPNSPYRAIVKSFYHETKHCHTSLNAKNANLHHIAILSPHRTAMQCQLHGSAVKRE